MDLARILREVQVLAEDVVLLLLDDARAGDQVEARRELPVELAERRIAVGLQPRVGADIERRAGHDAADREFQPVLRGRIDIQVIQPGHPVDVARFAVQPQFLARLLGLQPGIVCRLVARPGIDVDEQQLAEMLIVRDRGELDGVRQLIAGAEQHAPGVDAALLLEGEVARGAEILPVGVDVAEEIAARPRPPEAVAEDTVVVEIGAEVLPVGADRGAGLGRPDIGDVDEFAGRVEAVDRRLALVRPGRQPAARAVRRQREAEPVGRLESDGEAPGQRVVVAEIGARSRPRRAADRALGIVVLQQGVALVPDERAAHRELRRQRPAKPALDPELAGIAD